MKIGFRESLLRYRWRLIWRNWTMCDRSQYLLCLLYQVYSHSINRTWKPRHICFMSTKWHIPPMTREEFSSDKWFHLKTQVPAKTLVKRRETASLKIGNNWVNITHTSNCNLLHEQYSFQRSKHFLNMWAICSPSRVNCKIENWKFTYLDVPKVQSGPVYCILITQSSQHIFFHKPF